MTQSGPEENADAGPDPVCWVISDGKPGMENQCLGLAEAVGLPIVVKRIVTRAPWRWLPPRLWGAPLRAIDPFGDTLRPPWPALVIASGRQSVAPAAAIRRAARGRTICVQIQTPHLDPARFDLVIVPRHDRLRGENVVRTLGALHRVTADRLDEAAREFGPRLSNLPRPLVAALIGGSNRDYRLTPAAASELGRRLGDLARSCGGSLAVTVSRRTGAANADALRNGIGPDTRLFFWDGKGDNPYFGLLALADALVVTADSVSMTSEACATGKPVYVASLPGRSGKMERFHQGLRERGMTRWLEASIEGWSYTVPDDTARAAALVRGLLRHQPMTPEKAPVFQSPNLRAG